ncbi:MAG: mechanosensitive ion channel family protein [Deltaproteobacteria bacterium]|nr:mechanosensitive ion channel family protein [Deltaproteobacteria bacterium]MCW8892798.1 mechanosensitive ion channel family protein [Deltaproteobacteria bacterium]
MFEHIPAELRLFVIILSILAITVLVAWIIKRIIERALVSFLAKHKTDQTSLRFVRRLISTGIYLVGISTALTQIPEFRIIGHSLLAGAGILTVVGGLASQQVLSNVVSGFLIVFFRPFKIGDKITVNNIFTGVVEDITLRETVLRDFENNRIVVPNSLISSQVLVNANHTDERICKFIDIGIGYTSDIDRAMAIMVEEVIAHPLHIDNRTSEQKQNEDPVVVSRVISLGASSVNLRAWAWASKPADGFIMLCDLLRSIKQRFDSEGIEIPYPQTTLTFGQAETLKVATAHIEARH